MRFFKEYLLPFNSWSRSLQETYLSAWLDGVCIRSRILLRRLVGEHDGKVNFAEAFVNLVRLRNVASITRPLPDAYLAGQRIVNNPRPWVSFVRRVVSRWSGESIAADLRRSAQKKSTGGTGITLGFVGISMKKNEFSLITPTDEIEAACQDIRSIFDVYLSNLQLNLTNEQTYDKQTNKKTFSMDTINFGTCIAKGCNGVVYNATHVDDEFTKYAVKMMFNYDAASNAAAIWRSMYKECITYNGDFASLGELMETGRFKSLKAHPNIASIYGVFADRVPYLPGAKELYPSALPSRLNRNGYGRNMTLFLVMKRYDVSLNNYLRTNEIECKTATMLFAQLLEGVAYLVRNKIAHRDLKTDNILLDLQEGLDNPWLVITDFGSCVTMLKLPFNSNEVCRGGNVALMAPEVRRARPGAYSCIDYNKSDYWSAAALAYEIFKGMNPFYPYPDRKEHLKSHTYEEINLPQTPKLMPKPIAVLVKEILSRDPVNRPSITTATNLCHLILHCPGRTLAMLRAMRDTSEKVKAERILQWIRNVSISTMCQRKFAMNGTKLNPVEFKLRLTFLSQVQISHIVPALLYLK